MTIHFKMFGYRHFWRGKYAEKSRWKYKSHLRNNW